MRFKTKNALKDRVGERRVRRLWLWWPRWFGGAESRWWEWADLVEEICAVDVGGSGEWGSYEYRWCEVDFADETVQALREQVAKLDGVTDNKGEE